MSARVANPRTARTKEVEAMPMMPTPLVLLGIALLCGCAAATQS